MSAYRARFPVYARVTTEMPHLDSDADDYEFLMFLSEPITTERSERAFGAFLFAAMGRIQGPGYTMCKNGHNLQSPGATYANGRCAMCCRGQSQRYYAQHREERLECFHRNYIRRRQCHVRKREGVVTIPC
jgi:hypothetical protein